MAYQTPPTAIAGQPLTAANWNATIRDSMEDLAKPLRCKVRRTTTQSVPNVTATEVIWTAEDYDIGNFWVPGTPSKLTVPSGGGGTYLIIFHCNFSVNATGVRHFTIRHNGIDVATMNDIGNGTWIVGGTMSVEVIAVAGDTFSAVGYQNSGAALNLDVNYPMHMSCRQVAR